MMESKLGHFFYFRWLFEHSYSFPSTFSPAALLCIEDMMWVNEQVDLASWPLQILEAIQCIEIYKNKENRDSINSKYGTLC